MKKLFILILFLSFLNIFQVSFGAAEGYQPLSAIPGLTDTNVQFDSNGTNPSSGSGLSKYISGLYQWGVALTSGLAVLVIMWGGVGYMTSAGGSGIEEAKGRISAALMGLLLALGSYIILQTINKDLLKTTFDLKTLDYTSTATTNSSSGSSSSASTANSATGATQTGTSNQISTGNSKSGLSDDYVRNNVFKSNNIDVNNPYGVTNLDGIQDVAIQGLVTMKNESKVSSLMVTGGTESGHEDGSYSHSNGYKIDVRPDGGTFDNYITTNFNENGARENGDKLYVHNYGTYTATAARESNHWDIQFKPN